MRKNKFKKYIFVILCIGILFIPFVYTYVDLTESNKQITEEMKNNYISFDKIDSTGVSYIVKNHMKTMWDAIDVYM